MLTTRALLLPNSPANWTQLKSDSFPFDRYTCNQFRLQSSFVSPFGLPNEAPYKYFCHSCFEQSFSKRLEYESQPVSVLSLLQARYRTPFWHRECLVFVQIGTFDTPWQAMVKTLVMMSGELDYSSIFDASQRPPPATWPLFLIFVLLLTIVLMNLLVWMFFMQI